MTTDPRRHVPRTDAVLADPRLAEAARRLGRERVKRAVVDTLEQVRRGEVAPSAAAATAARALTTHHATRVINATGVVLHTNLGRAPLSHAARDAVDAAAGYTDVEFDLGTGRRARRGRHTLDALRAAVPDAGDALVVNNGAAALLLAITGLAAGREVIISRGELVEIGDGFRLPDLITSTGARLREVGTTNRTALADYAEALGPDTGCVLKVHPSNFRVDGFTAAVDADDLATLGVPVVSDIGSGLLRPEPLLPDEPDATTELRRGATVVTASGDKLLGGPQAGLLFGDAAVLAPLRHHPIARALRVDKLTLAALAATLDGPPPPTHAALYADAEQLRERADRLAARTGGQAVESAGAVGGGGAPGVELPGWALALPEPFAARLRLADPPVVGRVEHGRCLLDLRCVEPADDDVIAAAVIAAAAQD